MKKLYLLLMLFILIITMDLAGLEALDLIRKLDTNLTFNTIKYDGSMSIEISNKKYVKIFSAYAKGTDNYFMQFSNPEDAGVKYLKKNGKLYYYSDDNEEVVPITGHMLRESIMGSDLSYEDTVNNQTLEAQYNGRIVSETKFVGDTKFRDNDVWVLELVAKKNSATYAKQVMWVEKSTYLPLKIEYFSLSDVKIREYLLLDSQLIGKRYYGTKVLFRDILRKDSQTIFTMENIVFDINIPDNMFSLKLLRK